MSSLYDAAACSAPFVHPPRSLSQLLRHPAGYALCANFLERTPHLTAIHFWHELDRLNHAGGIGPRLTAGQRSKLEASVLARLRTSLIRKHREVSRAVRAHARPGAAARGSVVAAASLAPVADDEADVSDPELEEPTAEMQEAIKAAAIEFAAHTQRATKGGTPATLAVPAASTGSASSSPPAAVSNGDLLLDVIQLQLVDEPSSDETDGAPLPSIAMLTTAGDGEEFALHSYATQLTNHLMRRLPQLQAHLESMLADRYWSDIRASAQFDALVKAGPPTAQSIASGLAADRARLASRDSALVPAFNPATTKLVVTYLRKAASHERVPSATAKPLATNSSVHRGSSSGSGNVAGHSNSSSPASAPRQLASQWKQQIIHFDDHPTGVILFGRADHVDVTIIDSGVSRAHGQLIWHHAADEADSSSAARTLTYVDLDSTYGSRLNGQPVTTALLQVGSIISIGKHCTIEVRARDQRDDQQQQQQQRGGQKRPDEREQEKNADTKCTIQ